MAETEFSVAGASTIGLCNQAVMTMPIEHSELQLLVAISGCTYAHLKDNKNIFLMNIITTGSDDRKRTFRALNQH